MATKSITWLKNKQIFVWQIIPHLNQGLLAIINNSHFLPFLVFFFLVIHFYLFKST